jgi:hypothetical protein
MVGLGRATSSCAVRIRLFNTQNGALHAIPLCIALHCSFFKKIREKSKFREKKNVEMLQLLLVQRYNYG